eukprot:TRINITY_DN63716_c0_g1_i1.p1 TRINITY_DN63716_c0_g1~~TRINITY_DN63716_c0_g1_i1.p1  ORF type:complete len:481 (+),score=88.04 TRINITY_DN63716_c0_g1_i1:62-1444(+)
MKVVRDSKFRHVFGDASKQKYEDLRLSPKTTESCGIRASGSYFAFPWDAGGGGALAVIPNAQYGRQKRDLPLITGHSGPILDFEFNPFDDSMLCSASEDLTVKVWQIPEGGMKAHMREPLINLEGHGKKVTFSTFNPAVSGVVASAAFDFTVKTWSLEEQGESFSLTLPDHVMHLKWNNIGSLLAATCKDKKLRLIDPRASKIVGETKIHDGVKACKVEWLGGMSITEDSHRVVTTGFSAQAEREMGVWDVRKLSDKPDAEPEPLTHFVVDSGTGALFPFYDPGCRMLYVAGKGDGNVRFFEYISEDPYLHYISDYRSTTPQKGFDIVPKRCVNVGVHEVMRGLKLEASAVIPISFKVPRKSEAFQEDLFPDCFAGVPAMTADKWAEGAECKLAPTKSMKPGEDAGPAVAARTSISVVSVKDLKKQLAEAEAKIQALEAENAKLKAENAQLKGGAAGAAA